MITPRLQAIANHVLENEIMADIGTDHGYLPVFLMEQRKILKAIAADINSKPLEKAKKAVQESGFDASIETRLGSGLSVLLPGEAGTIVIAGMGGYLIRDLLEAELKVAKSAHRLILQPMNNAEILRKYLETHGFFIVNEDLAKEERRIYEIIVVEKGEMTITNPLDYRIGFEAAKKKHPLLSDLIDRQLELEYKIIANTRDKETKMPKEQYLKSTATITALLEVKDGG
ncbi:MAG: class I SAM-dependent methyltransferase [Eubacterium sp.]